MIGSVTLNQSLLSISAYAPALGAEKTNEIAWGFAELQGVGHLIKVASSFPEVSQNGILNFVHHTYLLKQKPTTLCMMIPITGLWWAPRMKSSIVKRSITIDGHKTSVSLEERFWSDLKQIARAQEATLPKLVAKIDNTRQLGSLSSAIRLYTYSNMFIL